MKKIFLAIVLSMSLVSSVKAEETCKDFNKIVDSDNEDSILLNLINTSLSLTREESGIPNGGAEYLIRRYSFEFLTMVLVSCRIEPNQSFKQVLIKSLDTLSEPNR